MMKRMCDCGCDHAITEYDAGQTPMIVQRGNLLLEIRVLPGSTGERPNVRPACARAAVAEGTVLFPRAESIVDPAAEEKARPHVHPLAAREVPEAEPNGIEAPGGEPEPLVGAPTSNGKAANGKAANGNAQVPAAGSGSAPVGATANGNGKAAVAPVVRPLKSWHRRG